MNVSLEEDLARVALLLAHPLHEASLFNQASNLLLLSLKSYRSRQISTRLFVKFSLLRLVVLVLVDFSQLDLSGDLFLGLGSCALSHSVAHLLELSRLLLNQDLVHLAKITLMPVKHLVNILLVHVLKEFALLVSKFPCKHFFTLSAETFHMFGLVFLKHFFDVDKTFLSLLKLFFFLVVIVFKLLHSACLLFILEHLVLGQFAISLLHRLIDVVLHLVTFFHILHKLSKHKHFLLSLSVFQKLLLFRIGL